MRKSEIVTNQSFLRVEPQPSILFGNPEQQEKNIHTTLKTDISNVPIATIIRNVNNDNINRSTTIITITNLVRVFSTPNKNTMG